MSSNKIIYPSSLKAQKLVVGVTAPSSGLGSDSFNQRIDLVINQHKDNGIKVIEGKCLREQVDYASGSPNDRADDFNQMILDQEINLIQPPWGGQKLIEILELIDFKSFSAKPKWIQGYSDISTLLFALTLKTGVATAHGTNFIDSILGQDSLTEKSRKYLDVAVGESFTQSSSDLWQLNFTPFEEKLDTKYNLTEPTTWKILKDEGKEVSIKGRMIGGCIDTIRNLIGTPFGDLPQFTTNYAKDHGIVLYLENCDLNPMQVLRTLYNMKYANWFTNINGVVFGRSSGEREDIYLKELATFFSDFNFPVVYDADIGHRPPQMTIINGAVGELAVIDGKATLIQTFI